jgi:hypothetical protein
MHYDSAWRIGHSLDLFQWQWKQIVCHSTICQVTPSKCTKAIAKNMEQTFQTMEEKGVPCFDLCQMLH